MQFLIRGGATWNEGHMSTKKKLMIGVASLVIAAGGVAVALWSATGTGSGTARALTAQTVTVTAQTGAADLYPGFTGGDVYFSLTNTNPYAITFTSMTAGVVTSGDEANCPASNVTVANASGLTLNVGANATSGTLTIANVASMASGAPDGCQGVTFTVALTLTGSQV